jgi:hypothetical protein
MAFNFLSFDFFNIQNPPALPTPPATPVLPSNALPHAAGPERHTFSSSVSLNVYPTNTSSIPGASSSFSALPMDTPTRYVPKSFRYNTPLNNNTFGAVNDSGYSSLSSCTSSYHLPSTPATNLPDRSPGATYLQLYESGGLNARKGSGSLWELQCLTCDSWVRTSVLARRPLSIPSHFSNLESHCSSSKCVARLARASSAPPVPSPRKSAPPSATPRVEDEDDGEEDEFEFRGVFPRIH